MLRRSFCGVLVFFVLTASFVPVIAQPVWPSSQPAAVSQAAQRRDTDPLLDDRLGATLTDELLWRWSTRFWLPWGGWWPER